MLSRALFARGAQLCEQATSKLAQVYNASCTKATKAASAIDSWKTLHDQGHAVNPCGSLYHPSVKAGLQPSTERVTSLQEAYSPSSTCFGCGPAAGDMGLHLRSFRAETGLEANVVFDEKYCCFPGVVSGGAISTVLDCHGNWAAALHLMDENFLPKPPLTVTYNISLTYKQPTPPSVPLHLTAKATKVTRTSGIPSKVTVFVELALYAQNADGLREVLVTGAGTYKKAGALRSF